MSGEKGFCPHKDPDYTGPSHFWCDDCAEIKDRIRYRDQRRYEIARDVMASLYVDGPNWPTTHVEIEKTFAKMAVTAADAILAALEETER